MTEILQKNNWQEIVEETQLEKSDRFEVFTCGEFKKYKAISTPEISVGDKNRVVDSALKSYTKVGTVRKVG